MKKIILALSILVLSVLGISNAQAGADWGSKVIDVRAPCFTHADGDWNIEPRGHPECWTIRGTNEDQHFMPLSWFQDANGPQNPRFWFTVDSTPGHVNLAVKKSTLGPFSSDTQAYSGAFLNDMNPPHLRPSVGQSLNLGYRVTALGNGSGKARLTTGFVWRNVQNQNYYMEVVLKRTGGWDRCSARENLDVGILNPGPCDVGDWLDKYALFGDTLALTYYTGWELARVGAITSQTNGSISIPYGMLFYAMPISINWQGAPFLDGVYIGCEVQGQADCSVEITDYRFSW
jgi:hypothetical protein